jgi:hypothetical protein
MPHDIIDLGFRGKATDAKPQGGMCHIFGGT